MGQFKPMVKMMTNEPSVILKLKKGGKVASKSAMGDGHKPMAGANPFADAEVGKAPGKPSMAERRRAMNPNQYAKGGKVAHKQLGGAMPVTPGMVPGAAAPAPAPMQAMGRGALGGAPMRPMGRSAVAGMTPAQRAQRAAMVQRAITGMKKGGSTADCAKLEQELKHHESMSAKSAHGKAGGGKVGVFAKTKMDTSKKDKAHGTGEVKEGKPGGYKMGGTIEGNEGKYANTKVVDGDKTDKAHGTGGVKMGNSGGFKKGGKVPGLTGATIEHDGDWENRPANSAKPGIKDSTTGEVRKGNAGGFKMGGTAKKAYATGGNVIDDGKAEKMPRHFVSKPVANSLQSGTFKKGGKVGRFSEGGSDYSHLANDASKGAYDKSIGPDEDDMGMARAIRSVPRKLYETAKEGIKSLTGMGAKPAGSVTKTEKSVTVTPKKRGGMC